MSVKTILHILVVGSCGKSKLTTCENPPGCKDISCKADLSIWRKRYDSLATPASKMYTGNQNRELVKGVLLLRKIAETEVDLKIISAGFGFLDENELIPPYECSFSGMKRSQIISRSERLEIGADFEQICKIGFDLIYLALGTDYFLALGDRWKKLARTTVIGFNKKLIEAFTLRIPSGHKIVHALSEKGYKIHGVTGFKGDLLRILAEHALKTQDPRYEILKWKQPSYLQDLIQRISGFSCLD